MTFLHPGLLAAGLAAIAIPIVIHLLMNRRRKPVMWGAMRFLVEAYKRQRRKLLIEKWLLLAARCLLLALLAVALGRPLLGALGLTGGGRTVYIVIDNALASGVRDDQARTALERHKAAARGVLSTLAAAGDTGDRVAIVTLGAPADGLVLPASANLSSLKGVIDQITLTHARADLPGAMSMIAQSIGQGDAQGGAGIGGGPRPEPERTFVVLLSDLYEGSVDPSPAGDQLGGIRLPAGVRVVALEPEAAGRANVSIAGVEPLRAGLIDPSRAAGDASGELVRVTLARSGPGVDQAQRVGAWARLTLPERAAGGDTGNGEIERRTVISFAPGQETATVAVPVRADRGVLEAIGAGRGRTGTGGAAGAGVGGAGGGASSQGVLVVQIDDDALEADNAWRRPVDMREALRVGIVAPIRFGRAERIDALDPGSWARLALAPGTGGEGGGGIEVVDIEPASLDQTRLAGLDAVVLPRPDLVSEASWARVRLFVESGGLAIVAPPPGVTVHLWGDAMSRGLGTGWSVEREASTHAGQRLVRPAGSGAVAGAGASSAGGLTGASGGVGARGVLSLIEGELDELLPAVSVNKTLAMSPAPESGAGAVLLALADGTPVVWAGGLGATGTGAGAGNGTEEAAGRGLVVYLGVALDLEYSDLPAKPLIVPLMQELVRQGSGKARGSYWAVAGSRARAPARAVELRELPDPARVGARGEATGRLKVDPELERTAEPARVSGVLRAVDEGGAGRGLVVVNADPRGGRTGAQSKESLAALLGPLTGGRALEGQAGAAGPVWMAREGEPEAWGGRAMGGLLGQEERGAAASLPLLIAALVLALLEVFLARRASHAGAGAGDSGGLVSQGRSA